MNNRKSNYDITSLDEALRLHETNPAAFEEWIYAVVLKRLTRSSWAEDQLHDGFLNRRPKIIDALAEATSLPGFVKFATMATLSGAIDLWRKEQRRLTQEKKAAEQIASGNSPKEAKAQREEAEQAFRAFMRDKVRAAVLPFLSLQQIQLFDLSYVNGLKPKAIAKVMGWSIASCHTRCWEMRKIVKPIAASIIRSEDHE